MLHFDALANKLLSTVRLKYFSAYVHTDFVVKSLELSSMHGDVKLKFNSLFGVTPQKVDMKNNVHKAVMKTYVMTKNKMLRDAWNALMQYLIAFKSRLTMSRR
jgi:hypothetical protein